MSAIELGYVGPAAISASDVRCSTKASATAIASGRSERVGSFFCKYVQVPSNAAGKQIVEPSGKDLAEQRHPARVQKSNFHLNFGKTGEQLSGAFAAVHARQGIAGPISIAAEP